MKLSNYIHLAFLLAFLTIMSSCDKIETPIINNPGDTTNTTALIFDTLISGGTTAKRNIFLEEFTGHTCANCPQGAIEAHRLDSAYGGQVIPIAIHAGVFSFPENNTDGSFSTDFRTDAGNAYNTGFAVASYPTAMISRLGSPDLLTKGNWEARVQTIENDASLVDLIINNYYNDSLQILKTKIELEWLSSMQGSYKLNILLTESHIIDWQLDDVTKISNYEHNHALRDAINGTWGEAISTSNIGDTFSFSHQYTIPPAWIGSNCELIALIYDVSSFEVIQCERLYLK